ncbi:MAG: hypothetical protein HKO57_00900, partial [Akkermansiaceae bacterium]|nr:hypothetical protein [Akkermansiaceae bacterium]
VAAIHGACVGGGYELALACDWRLASDSSKTRLGLPETMLGILPAWGGCTRLPRLIGLPAALGIILPGKVLKAAAARHKGLVDAVVPEEYLLAKARAILSRGKRRLEPRRLLHNPLSVAVIRKKARANLIAKTRGLYPAPLRALDVACKAVRSSVAKSLAAEHAAILDLAARPETKNLIRVFFLTERAKKLRIPGADPRPVRNVTVIGAGVMGAGIAYWLSSRGLRVNLQDISAEALAKGMASIRTLYQTSAKKRILSKTEAARGLDRVVPALGPIPLQREDLVIEAATEDLEIKRMIFDDLAQRAGPQTILATNTSALPLRHLAASLDNPSRLVGLHFFNPVHRMKLIEVVRAEATSGPTLATAINFVQRIGKLPVVVGDEPGFLVNRILMPYLMEAGLRFANGGDPVAIDRSMLDFGMPMGPLRLLDEVGLDVAMHVAETLSAAFPDRMKAPPLLKTMATEGLVGRKGGAGFYLYDQKGPRPNPAALELQGPHQPLPDDLGHELALTMVREAARCLDEDVAETADDIDLAMILGTGFAPFRGGPMRYAEDNDLLRPRRTPEATPTDFPDLKATPAPSS